MYVSLTHVLNESSRKHTILEKQNKVGLPDGDVECAGTARRLAKKCGIGRSQLIVVWGMR